MKNQSQTHYTTYQLKLPVDLGKIIEISDPVYTFCEVMDHIDLNKYLVLFPQLNLAKIKHHN